MNLILASQSPRRRELLGLTGLDFTVRVADIDETMDPGKAPFDEVARVSRMKALAVEREPGDVVIAADHDGVRGDDHILRLPGNGQRLQAADPGNLVKGRFSRAHTFVNIRHPDNKVQTGQSQKLPPTGRLGR